MSKQKRDSNCQLSRSSSERRIFYMDDTSLEQSCNPSSDVCQPLYNRDTSYPPEDRSSVYPPSADAVGFQLNENSALHFPSSDDERRLSVSARSKITGQKPGRKYSDHDQRSSRRSSVQSNRSRINSCSRPTPLGRKQLGHQTFRSMRNARSFYTRSLTQ